MSRLLRIVVALAMSVLLSKVTRAEVSESRLRDRLTASTVYVVVDHGDGRYKMGTGWIFNDEAKTVMTALHVIENAKSVAVVFAKRTRSGWVTDLTTLQQTSRLELATVAWQSENVDAAILHVPTMPDHVAGLPMVANEPSPKEKLYCVGHPNTASDIFHFSRLDVQYTGFAAVTTLDDIRIRSEIISVAAGEIAPGASGSAVVNAKGEVVGIVSGQVQGPKGNGTIISSTGILRELSDNVVSGRRASGDLTGRWIARFTNTGSELGVEFTEDKQFAFVMPAGKIAGTFKIYGTSLYTKFDGKNEKLKIEWINNDSFKFLSSDFPVICQRYDSLK